MPRVFPMLLLLLLATSACRRERVHRGFRKPPPQGEVPHFYHRLSAVFPETGPVTIHIQRYGADVSARMEGPGLRGFYTFNDYDDSIKTDSVYVLGGYDPSDRTDPADLRLTLYRSSAGWAATYNAALQVSLSEDYPAGSVRLVGSAAFDSVLLQNGPQPNAHYSYGVLFATAAGDSTAGYVAEAVRNLLGFAPTEDAEDSRGNDAAAIRKAILEELDNHAADYFDRYFEEVGPTWDGDVSSAMFYNYSSSLNVYAVRNAGGWLVLQGTHESYTGGAHGNSQSDYANLDLQTGRCWGISDLLRDTAAVAPLLQQAARETFGIAPEEDIDIRLLVPRVPVSDEVIVMPTGLFFVYDPYEIASYADGEVHLFLPYTLLGPYLTPAALQRLGLQQRAGKA